jgi:putative addiction module component (TIGR02574 family)
MACSNGHLPPAALRAFLRPRRGEPAPNHLDEARWCRDCGVTYARGMSRTLEQIEDEVLRLPEESRARLMERLLASFQVQAGSDEEGIARAWAEEAQRRDDEMSSGSEKGVPAEEVFSKLRSRR